MYIITFLNNKITAVIKKKLNKSLIMHDHVQWIQCTFIKSNFKNFVSANNRFPNFEKQHSRIWAPYGSQSFFV